MFILFFRAIIIYSIVLFVFRLMGKRQLGQLQPFEFVLTLIIADLATLPMSENSVPILHGIIPLLTLVTMHFLLTVISRKCKTFNKLISGKPMIVINPKGIDYKTLRALNISVEDLFEQIRSSGYFSFEEVQYAIIETNGRVNVIPKKEYAPLTQASSKNTNEETTIPITLISEGSLNIKNFNMSNVEDNFSDWILKKTNTKSIKDILICTIDGNNKIFFQTKSGEALTFEYNKERSTNEEIS